MQNSKNLSFSLIFLNKRSIKLNMTSYDVFQSVAASLHSTLICNIHCKYTQTISIHHKEQIYVERQTERMEKLPIYWWYVCWLTSSSSFIEANDIATGSSSSFIHISSPTSFILMTSLLSSEDCTLVSLHKPCTTLGASVQLYKTNMLLSVMCAFWPSTL